MEKRNITVTLNKAKEWFNSGNEALKEIALQAFDKDELTYNFKNITTFKKACEALGLNYNANFIRGEKIKHNGIIPLIYKRIICTLWKGHNYIPVSPEDLSGKRLFECKYCKKQHVL